MIPTDIEISFGMIVILVVCVSIFLISIAIRYNLVVYLFSIAIFISTISIAKTFSGRVVPTWIMRMQYYRADMLLGLGVLLLLGAALHQQHARGVRLPFQVVLLILAQLFASLLRLFHDGVEVSVQSLLFAFIVTGSFIVTAQFIAEGLQSIRVFTKIILTANIIWVFSIMVQFGLNSSSLVINNRFLGLTGNPQHAAVALSFLTVVSLWLAFSGTTHRQRVLAGAVTTLNIAFLLWTGSRTGILMFTIGASFILFRRLGKVILVAPVLAVFVYALAKYFLAATGSGDTTSRILSFDNTRSGVFTNMFNAFIQSPIVGVGVNESGSSENSYLYAFASYGVGMGLLVIALLIVSIIRCQRLRKMAKMSRSDEYKSMIELAIALQALYFLGGVTEGYMIARMNAVIPIFIISVYIGQICLEQYNKDPDQEY